MTFSDRERTIARKESNDVILKISEVAVRLRCSRRQVFRYIEQGRLRVIRFSPRHVGVRESEVEAFIAASARRAA